MTIGKLGNHQRDKSQHHSRAQSHVSHSTKKFIKWIRKIPSKRRAHRKLPENVFGVHDNPLYCSPAESIDGSLLPQYAHSFSTTAYSGVMSDVSACLGYSDVHVSTNYGPHVMSTYGGSLCESGLHSFQTEQCVCGDSSSPRRTLESPFASHGHFTAAYLPHHYHPQPVAHSQPQMIHGSAEGHVQHNHGSSHPHYHLTSKSHMHQCVGAERVAHRRTKSLPDSISTPVATESLDTSKPSMPVSCERTKLLPDLSTHMTTDIMLDTQNQPSTPVRCKPVLLGENTTASEWFSTTSYHLAPNLQLLKENSISSENIGATSSPHLFIKKRHRSKKARRRSRPSSWNYASQLLQSGIEMDDESLPPHSDSSSADYNSEPTDSSDEGIGLWQINQRSATHMTTTPELPVYPRSQKGAAAQENVRLRSLTTSRGANKHALGRHPIVRDHLSDYVPFVRGSPSSLPSLDHSRILQQENGGSRHPPAVPYETVVTVHNGVVTETTEC